MSQHSDLATAKFFTAMKSLQCCLARIWIFKKGAWKVKVLFQSIWLCKADGLMSSRPDTEHQYVNWPGKASDRGKHSISWYIFAMHAPRELHVFWNTDLHGFHRLSPRFRAIALLLCFTSYLPHFTGKAKEGCRLGDSVASLLSAIFDPNTLSFR